MGKIKGRGLRFVDWNQSEEERGSEERLVEMVEMQRRLLNWSAGIAAASGSLWAAGTNAFFFLSPPLYSLSLSLLSLTLYSLSASPIEELDLAFGF